MSAFGALRGMAVLARARIGRGTSAQGFYASRLRYRELAFDVGANVGNHTRAMLKRGARVVALEPQADLAGRLVSNFPTATVRACGVSDRGGEATLITSASHAHLATLNPIWAGMAEGSYWDGEATIRLTTLDDLIAEFGLPTFIKIDTEGLEDKVLAGLSQPVQQLLFETHSQLSDVAARCFARLSELGQYEYRMMENGPLESWVLGPPTTAAAILSDLPEWGDVYARRIDPRPASRRCVKSRSRTGSGQLTRGQRRRRLLTLVAERS